MKRKKVCGGPRTPTKKRFATLAEIQFTIMRAAEWKKKLWPYLCPDCGTYHLTSRQPRQPTAPATNGAT